VMKAAAAFLVVAIVLSPVASIAQSEPSSPSVFSDYLGLKAPSSLLHIPGLGFTSSMGVSYYSGGKESFGMSYYMGHFSLALSSSLTLACDVGVGSMLTGRNISAESPQLLLPNVDLTYHPSDNFSLKLQFHQYRSSMGSYLLRPY
jgi:hypothetical protein